MRIDTSLAQAGNRKDKVTGSISLPVHYSTTFSHPSFGESTGFDYSRTLNPTRQVLEELIAELENGLKGFAFSSGMSAISCVFHLFKPGDHIVASKDLYGGTYRLFEQILSPLNITTTYINTSKNEFEASIKPNTKALFIETPTNPTMKVTDIKSLTNTANNNGIITIVDNTFMTPYFQLPLNLGADIVIHSATKYLGGHNDVTAGLIVTKEKQMSEKIYFLQNSIGSVLNPHDCWLLIRGMKTLALRMERHQENALSIAKWLNEHPLITKVYYPGLETDPGYRLQKIQSSGFGGMVSFEVADEAIVKPFLSKLKIISFAESLGGVESLITFPATQTHFDIPKEIRETYGVNERLLRFSVGIEDPRDLIEDIRQALSFN